VIPLHTHTVAHTKGSSPHGLVRFELRAIPTVSHCRTSISSEIKFSVIDDKNALFMLQVGMYDFGQNGAREKPREKTRETDARRRSNTRGDSDMTKMVRGMRGTQRGETRQDANEVQTTP